MSSWSQIEAEKAFSSASRARRRASLTRRLRGRRGRLRAPGRPRRDRARRRARGGRPRDCREIPLAAINAHRSSPTAPSTSTASSAPRGPTRSRWQSVWLAEQRGTLLPPIAVVRVGDAYAIRDGHHRVSVARARGALTIDAVVSAA